MQTYKILNEKNLPESEVELEIEISAEVFGKYRTTSIKKLSESANIPGFRKGHIPENILVQKLGEKYITEETAYIAIEEIFPKVILDKKLAVLGEPQIAITKIAAGNPLNFKITVSVMPEITLPDYKKIAATENQKKSEDVSVSEKELNDFIENIRKSFAENVAPKEGDEGKKELPEVNDEFVKKLGDFQNVEDFKNKIKENLEHEKEHKAHDKRKIAVADGILDKTKMIVPKALIESELVKLMARFQDDVTRMGIKLEDYLKQVKKTADDLRKEWRPDAEKHAKLQLVLNAIAETEKLSADKKEIEHEVKHLLDEYKNIDPKRAHDYVNMMLTNEKVFQFLEEQK